MIIRTKLGAVNFNVKDRREHIQSYWMNGSFYETHGNGLLSHMYRNKEKYRGKVILDVGASIGNHALFFSEILKASKVVAIEPFRPSYMHMIENMNLNRGHNILALEVAVGEKEGKVTMIAADEPNHPNVGMRQVRSGKDVVLTTIDKVVKDLNIGVDVVKIDVEHYNKEVLKGAKEFFTTQKPEIFIECETEKVLKETDKILNSYGYERTGLVVNHTPTYQYI